MSCSYTLLKDENERLEMLPLEENEPQFWKFRWKYFFLLKWGVLWKGSLLGVFNKKFVLGSVALDMLPHLKIPAVGIIVGKQSGSFASLAEICVAAGS